MKDTEWLELLGSSPQKAYSILIDEYGDLVYAIVINKLKGLMSREEIEDCVSDVFVSIFTSAENFKASAGSLKGFISTIAKNTAIDAFRRISYRRNNTDYIEDETVTLPPAGDKPDVITEEKLFKKHLWETVKSLGEPDSSIITFQYFYDMKVSDIADRLGMKPSAVQKRSIRARKRIKKLLTDENNCERSFCCE